MNMLDSSVFDNSLQAFGLAMFHALWQGMIISLLCWLLLQLLSQKAASLRFFIAYSCLLVLFAVFMITFYQLQSLYTTKHQTDHRYSLQPIDIPLFTQEADHEAQPGGWPQLIGMHQQVMATLRFYAPYIAIGWMLGFLYFFVQLSTGLYRLKLLKRQSYQPPVYWLHTAKRLQQQLFISRQTCLLVSSHANIPFTSGWLKPVVMLPSCIFTELSAEELETIILHELAHIKRYDYLLNLIQATVKVILFFNPAYWYLSSVIEQEREQACDQITVKNLPHPLPYARALVRLTEICKNTSTDISMAATGKNYLQHRIYNIMQHSSSSTSRSCTITSRWYQLIAIAAFGLLFLAVTLDGQGNRTKLSLANSYLETQHLSDNLNIVQTQTVLQKKVRISGKIIDAELGEPLENISVSVAHRDSSTYSQPGGRFTIQANLDTDTLVFSAPGYQEIRIVTGSAMLNVALQKTTFNPLKSLASVEGNHILYVIDHRTSLIGDKGTLNTLLYDLKPEKISAMEIAHNSLRDALVQKFVGKNYLSHTMDVVLIQTKGAIEKEKHERLPNSSIQKVKKLSQPDQRIKSSASNNIDDSTLYIIDGVVHESPEAFNKLQAYSVTIEIIIDKSKLAYMLNQQQLADHKKFVLFTTDDYKLAHTKSPTSSSEQHDTTSANLPENRNAVVVYPNPLTHEVLNISFNLQAPQKVRIDLLNEQGEIVQKIDNSQRHAGAQEIQWIKRNLPAGIYFIKVVGTTDVFTQKLIVP